MPEPPVPDSPKSPPLCRQWVYQDAIDYLYGRIDYERTAGSRTDHRFRLGRTVELFEQLGLGDYLHRPNAPESADRPKVPVVHIAGTKGKGSTATMVSEILATAGYRVGLYTSPHLTKLEERFRINGVPCSRDSLVELVKIIAPVVDRFNAPSDSASKTTSSAVSFFELTTAMAVLHFDRNDCDVIILEVGLGGRLDSTNVCASTVAAVTSIGLDHQRVLGDTISQIAAEKAGIIKAPVPVISGVTLSAAANEIQSATVRAGGDLLKRGEAFGVRDYREVAGGSEFVYSASSPDLINPDSAAELPLFLSLIGAHQIENAAIAISIVRRLANCLPVTDSQIADGLRQVRCIGRLEQFQLNSPSNDRQTVQIILDTAHNHDSIVALRNAVESRTIRQGNQQVDRNAKNDMETDQLRRPIIVVFGTSRDKDVTSMAWELAQLADEIICTQFTTNPRFVDVDQLVEAFSGDQTADDQTNINDAAAITRLHGESDPQIALAKAIELASRGGTVIVCGSFFLAGQLRPNIIAMCNSESQATEASVTAKTQTSVSQASSPDNHSPKTRMEAP